MVSVLWGILRFMGESGVGLVGGVSCCIRMILRFCNQLRLVRLSSRESLEESLWISGGFLASQFCLKRKAASLVVSTGVLRMHFVAPAIGLVVVVSDGGVLATGVVGVCVACRVLNVVVWATEGVVASSDLMIG